MNTGSRFFRKTADVLNQFRIFVKNNIGQVATIVQNHIQGTISSAKEQGLLNAPVGIFQTLSLPGIYANTGSSDGRSGMILGEGAAMLVLEPHDAALARGARIWGEVLGFGMSSDAGHITQPCAEGEARAMRLALEDAPEEADHIALVAWLSAMKPGADLTKQFRAVDRAAKAEPSNLRVRWYRGQLLKRLGKERLAQEDFRMIVEKDPRHVDAQRELRLFELSRGQRKSSSDSPAPRLSDAPGQPRTPPPASGEKGGFFGKLFKK